MKYIVLIRLSTIVFKVYEFRSNAVTSYERRTLCARTSSPEAINQKKCHDKTGFSLFMQHKHICRYFSYKRNEIKKFIE